jgi:hypothetical protein
LCYVGQAFGIVGNVLNIGHRCITEFFKRRTNLGLKHYDDCDNSCLSEVSKNEGQCRHIKPSAQEDNDDKEYHSQSESCCSSVNDEFKNYEEENRQNEDIQNILCLNVLKSEKYVHLQDVYNLFYNGFDIFHSRPPCIINILKTVNKYNMAFSLYYIIYISKIQMFLINFFTKFHLFLSKKLSQKQYCL